MEVIPLSESVGAQIRGVDLSSPFDDPTFDAMHQAWLEHLVIVFREQSLSDQNLVQFSARFGELDAAPVDKFGRKFSSGFPELTVISNVVENGQPIGGLGNFEAVWHTDMSYNETPPKGSALYSREVPDSGGNTGFLNMYAIYESLPHPLRERIEGLQLKHDATHNSAGELRSGMDVPVDIALSPGAIHPLVRTHPDSARRALFLGRRPYAYIMGLTRAESDTLLDELWAHCEQPQFSWHHQWDVGDLVLWDNRCAMHRRDSFDDAQRRLMVRTQIQGDRPS
ncbi:MAG: taurine dioxygenase [Gammaproteobacteria bacterium]|jgi:taurine dioxygenase